MSLGSVTVYILHLRDDGKTRDDLLLYLFIWNMSEERAQDSQLVARLGAYWRGVPRHLGQNAFNTGDWIRVWLPIVQALPK